MCTFTRVYRHNLHLPANFPAKFTVFVSLVVGLFSRSASWKSLHFVKLNELGPGKSPLCEKFYVNIWELNYSLLL